MLRHVLFDLSLFSGEGDRANSQKRVLALLQALTYCNQLYLRQYPDTPLIYKSGIVYKAPNQFQQATVPEVDVVRGYLELQGAVPSHVHAALDALERMTGGGEVFREIPRIIENGGGDCDNVASWRAAELRELGINARPYITWRRRIDGGMTYHVVVLWPDGSHEDPSLLLGMGGASREADRAEEERKMGERMANFARALVSTRNVDRSIAVLERGDGDEEVVGQLPSDFGRGLQYTHAFQTDDAYESWSPTIPSQFFHDERYASGLTQGTPYFNTRMRDPDDDLDDRF